MKNKSSLKWLYNITKKQIPIIVTLSVLNAILAIIGVSVALISKKVIDAAVVIASRPSGVKAEYTTLTMFALILLGDITLRLILRITTQSISVKTQARMEMGMRTRMFESIINKDFSKISQHHSGELMNRITSDISIVSNGMVSLIPEITFLVFQFSGAMAVLIAYDWRFTLVFILGGIVIFVIVNLFRRKLKELHKLVQSTDGKTRSFLQESLESLIVVKTFGIEEEIIEKAKILQMDNYNAKMSRRKVSIYANAGFNFVFNIGYIYALVWCSLKLCTKAMTYGTLTAVLQLISQIQSPFVNFTKVFPHLFGIMASAERIMEIEALEPENSVERSEKINVEDTYSKLKGIEFKDIKFSYDRDNVLEGGYVEIRKGDFVAIRGISGIGKSTLLKMLLGVFKPNEGNISLLMEDGSKVEASPSTRDLFSYVPQGNYLFSGTLKENLLLVRPNATEEEIREALRVGDCLGFIDKLPKGLETVIGEKGLGLSEGQVQRMAIARAVLSKAPIILLDEATSALDEKTEEKVLNNIKNIKNSTCITITHKTAALRVCNKEIVIEDKVLSCLMN